MKTLIITGASKGIGLATASRFCDEGYRVINFSRSKAPDARIESHAVDLTLDHAAEQVRTLLHSLLLPGEITLVHNAAKLINDTLQKGRIEDFTELLNLNVVAPQRLNQAVLPLMLPGSSIIYIGSTLAEKAVANSFSYVTSKHAVIGMMRATCQDLRGTGIHTTCVCPGFTNTEMLREHVGSDQQVLASIASLSTFGRLIASGEIANTVFFAASNPVINGAIIHANLGQVES